MSVIVRILRETDIDGKEYGEPAFQDPRVLFDSRGVIGHVLALVVKSEDGGVTLERDICVSADNAEDNQLAESVVKDIEAKLNEAFPDPNKKPESSIWVPR
jgi:hypothetical protein